MSGALDDRRIWSLEAELRQLRELLSWRSAGFEKDIARLERAIKANGTELDALKASINAAIRWLAIGAGAIIFELVRTGKPF